MESPADIEHADVSNKLGAAVGSSNFLYFKFKWLCNAFIPFEPISHILNPHNIGQDVEVRIKINKY